MRGSRRSVTRAHTSFEARHCRASSAVVTENTARLGSFRSATSRVSLQSSASSTTSTLRVIAKGCLRQEAIAHAMHGQKVPRNCGFRFQLLAQPYHVSVHGARMRERIVAPYRIQNHLARQGAVRVLEEISEQIVLGAR